MAKRTEADASEPTRRGSPSAPNLHAPWPEELRKLWDEAITADDKKLVFRALAGAAKRGDLEAIRLFLECQDKVNEPPQAAGFTPERLQRALQALDAQERESGPA